MIFDELVSRGLVKQTTNAEKIRELLDNQKIAFYIGFDPTADSLHVGHLLQLVTAKRLMEAGHKALILIGSATAHIGDPSGKSQMRPMMDTSSIEDNAWKIQRQIADILKIDLSKFDTFVDNSSWFKEEKFLEFLRDVGSHFSVNNMLRAECFKSRLETGLSFLEFNYMIMQAFDFLVLHNCKDHCVLQIGGDDQWSNMLAGIDLIHKKTGHEAFALTLPLLTNSDGTKMGKTENGAVWLDPSKTSAFDFFQFWRNISDGKVKQCINFFTDKVCPAFTDLSDQFSNINEAKKFLAFEITKLVHGEQLARQSLEQAEALFEKQDTSAIEAISVAEGTHILDLVIKCGFAKSRTEARNLISNRGITINEEVQTNPTINISKSIFGNELIVKKGKKHFCRLLIEGTCQDQNS
jgi:tyrosyl-tRNA synthetase